jgi:hypothetical protein
MVAKTKIFLVNVLMIWRQVLFGLLMVWLCMEPRADAATPASKNDSCSPCQFWLWPGAKLPPTSGGIDRVYLLQGFFAARNHPARFIDQGHNATPLKNIKELVLVYRLDALQPASNIIAQFQQDAQGWMQNGNNVIGMQLDFDAATGNIKEYNLFLQDIRQVLTAKFQLSITGLLDWMNAPFVLTTANEVVLQTYQGKQSVAQLERYLTHLQRIQHTIPIDFKLGIVQGTTLPIKITDSLNSNPKYRGQVIFLLQRHR